MAVSYGNVIQLFDVNKNDYIGYFINEKPILRLMFVFNSILALITENFNIKLVNTYDFIPKEYNPQVDNKPTKKCLISYELFDISKFGISGQEFEVNINNNLLKKYCYTNKIIAKVDTWFGVEGDPDAFGKEVANKILPDESIDKAMEEVKGKTDKLETDVSNQITNAQKGIQSSIDEKCWNRHFRCV